MLMKVLPASGRLTVALVVLCTALLSARASAWAQECGSLGWIREGSVEINAAHVFCGEIKEGKPKGFHSMALRESAGRHLIRFPLRGVHARGHGIYDARVDFKNDARKFSTFFPDACSYQEVLSSIVYAFRHQVGEHPVWGVLGRSAPAASSRGHCLGADGNAFEIRMGLLRGTARINTAFPN